MPRGRVAKHGHNQRSTGPSPEYRVWMSMIQRCTNTKNRAYRHYGGRGISVAERWRNFENFLADMGPRPDGFTIERLDVNVGYQPGNCTWVPSSAQSKNRRDSVSYTIDGVTRPRGEWCLIFGVPLGTVRTRLRAGWEIKLAFSSPPLRASKPRKVGAQS